MTKLRREEQRAVSVLKRHALNASKANARAFHNEARYGNPRYSKFRFRKLAAEQPILVLQILMSLYLDRMHIYW